MTVKWVYAFGGGSAEGGSELKNLLGGKGADLAQMCKLGLPVPPGFTITTEACAHYDNHNQALPEGLKDQVTAALRQLGALNGGALGDPAHPLLVSVRSGARISMPGMMDTVLNLGLNTATVQGLALLTGDARFAYDCYRRFIQMYGDVVLGLDPADFEDIIESHKQDKGVELDTDLDASDLKSICEAFKAVVIKQLNWPFPEDVQEQLWGAMRAVFASWRNPRASAYRRLNGIPEDWGTAVTVQAMVFGNDGPNSATGVAFTRDPATGDKTLFGEFLVNAQGEDVVAGVRTPQPVTKAMRQSQGGRRPSMQEAMPEAFAQLAAIGTQLEIHYRDMQDVEFTVQDGRLFLLQTRRGKRTAKAALKMAVDMVEEGLIDKSTAIQRIDAGGLDQLLHPTLDPDAPRDEITAGLGASPGAATGEVVFTSQEAAEMAAADRDVILVRSETSTEDVHGMHAARGVLTARGGMTSHAAVLARGMGRPCVSGAGSLKIDAAKGEMTANGITVRRGEVITIDGATGKVFRGAVGMRQPELNGDFATVMNWADDIRALKVRADADTPADAAAARRFGADGIGLCRTEYMFLGADDDLLLPKLRSGFEALFREMTGLPVAIRLLDPRHLFVRQSEDIFRIYALQTCAILEAAMHNAPERLEIMIPLTGQKAGFDEMAACIRGAASAIKGSLPAYKIGAMTDAPLVEDATGTADFFCLSAEGLAGAAQKNNLRELVRVAKAHMNPNAEKPRFSVCGERGDDPALVRFCHDSGFDYVSCMSSRVPIVRIVAAQAAIQPDTKKTKT